MFLQQNAQKSHCNCSTLSTHLLAISRTFVSIWIPSRLRVFNGNCAQTMKKASGRIWTSTWMPHLQPITMASSSLKLIGLWEFLIKQFKNMIINSLPIFGNFFTLLTITSKCINSDISIWYHSTALELLNQMILKLQWYSDL